MICERNLNDLFEKQRLINKKGEKDVNKYTKR